ncbi:MAG: hypothetical protein ACRDHD_09200 [Candidatus Limnocylindria bacterium]
MDWYMIVLRILHIGSGVFWVGAAAVFFWFIEPSIKAAGPGGQAVMREITIKRRFPVIITAAATLTVLAGFLLYLRASDGFRADWIQTGTGLGITVGALAAIGAWLAGFFLIKPRVDRLGAIGAAVQAGGGPPTDAQIAEIQSLERQLRTIGLSDLVLLGLAVVAMAVARYLG